MQFLRKNGRHLRLAQRLCAYFSLWVLVAVFPVLPVGAKQPANRYASIIIDANSLEILHARNIDDARFPASLTKMMTLYLTFDALARGEISLQEKMSISARAARTPAVRLGLRAGGTLTVEQAIQALAVRSANDAAVVLAERLAGSEDEFAVLMTRKAKALGMRSTVFKNANGLPNSAQFTTARDMAKLAEALLLNHRVYYPYFSQKTFRYGGRTYTNHNALLGKVEGVDGFKTGFTNASGYNLVLSSIRNNQRIIAVVLGGASGRSRDKHMADLIERGFDVLAQNEKRQISPHALYTQNQITPAAPRRDAPLANNQIKSFTLRAAYSGMPQTSVTPATVRIVQGANGMVVPDRAIQKGWAVQLGAFTTGEAAQAESLQTFANPQLALGKALPQIIPVQRETGTIFRARIIGLSYGHAQTVCKSRAARGRPCLVIAP
jgi:D-alanyl-D-alanine carboxypeptidase